MQKSSKLAQGSIKKQDDDDWSDEEEEVMPITIENGDEKKLRNSILFNKTPAASRHAEEKKKNRFPKHLREHTKPGGTRYQSSSTSTLFVTSTPSTPDINEVLGSMATALYYHIASGHKQEQTTFIEIFSEEKYPITKKQNDTSRVPRVKEIYKFISTIFKVEKLPSECAILCLAYIERLISFTTITLHASNWRRVVLSALILASKVWEDQAVWNVDFLSVFPNVTVQDLKNLEKKLLGFLQYNVNVTGGLYAKYYFELREVAEKDDKRFPLQPLDKQGIERLEHRANSLEQSVKKNKFKTEMVRSSSSDNLPVRSPKVILS